MKQIIKKTALDIYSKIYDIADKDKEEKGDMIELEIGNKLFEVDFKAYFEDEDTTFLDEWDSPDYKTYFNEIEVRNIWHEEKDFTNVIKELNKELSKIIL